MYTMPQTGELATDNLRHLAYVQHMAQTAQPAAAKRLFELFAHQENRRIEAQGGFQLSASGHGVGGAQTPLASVSEGGPVRLTRAGSRLERAKAIWQKSDATTGETMR